MRIAVASKSGTEVDQHFGHAERFLLYECADGVPNLVGDVKVEKYCSFDVDHPFREKQFGAIVDALRGCSAVVMAMVGELPRQELKKAGIEPVTADGPIDPVVLRVHGRLSGRG